MKQKTIIFLVLVWAQDESSLSSAHVNWNWIIVHVSHPTSWRALDSRCVAPWPDMNHWLQPPPPIHLWAVSMFTHGRFQVIAQTINMNFESLWGWTKTFHYNKLNSDDMKKSNWLAVVLSASLWMILLGQAPADRQVQLQTTTIIHLNYY